MAPEFLTRGGETLNLVFLDHEEKRPVGGELSPAVWLARIVEQVGLAGVNAWAYGRELDDHGRQETAEALEARESAGIKLAVAAVEAISALSHLTAPPERQAEARVGLTEQVDRKLHERLTDSAESNYAELDPRDWVASVASLVGVTAAAVGTEAESVHEFPDPRDSGAIYVDLDEEEGDQLPTSLLIVAMQATLACHFLFDPD